MTLKVLKKTSNLHGKECNVMEKTVRKNGKNVVL